MRFGLRKRSKYKLEESNRETDLDTRAFFLGDRDRIEGTSEELAERAMSETGLPLRKLGDAPARTASSACDRSREAMRNGPEMPVVLCHVLHRDHTCRSGKDRTGEMPETKPVGV